MCTLLILRRPDHRWPLLLAANRDEMAGRPWRPPGRHWPDRPEVVAGLDELAGGSWLGLNDHGVVAGVLNRRSSLGPARGKRSRGELVLDALDHADARDAAAALAALDPAAYRSFNLVVADNRDAFWLRLRSGEEAGDGGAAAGSGVEVQPITAGLHMVTAYDMDDPGSPRIRRHRPRFAAAPAPDPDADGGAGDWAAWEALLASRETDAGGDEGAMTVIGPGGFGTVSSALVALPAADSEGAKPVLRFAPGRPGETPFEPVPIQSIIRPH